VDQDCSEDAPLIFLNFSWSREREEGGREGGRDGTYVPGKGYVFDICENESCCSDSRVAPWASEVAYDEVTDIHPRGAGSGYNCYSEDY
jgi:hypothetical protein